MVSQDAATSLSRSESTSPCLETEASIVAA
jgi:hypothetical protein